MISRKSSSEKAVRTFTVSRGQETLTTFPVAIIYTFINSLSLRIASFRFSSSETSCHPAKALNRRCRSEYGGGAGFCRAEMLVLQFNDRGNSCSPFPTSDL